MTRVVGVASTGRSEPDGGAEVKTAEDIGYEVVFAPMRPAATTATTVAHTTLSLGLTNQRTVAVAAMTPAWPDGKDPHPAP